MGRKMLAAVEAIHGGVALLSGVAIIRGDIPIPRRLIDRTPFPSAAIPGAVLSTVVGGSALAAAATLLSGRPEAPDVVALSGLMLSGWIAVQVAMIREFSWLQPAYFALGMALLATGLNERERDGRARR